MHSTFDTTNNTRALCTYIASNTTAVGTSTKPATAETPAQQITRTTTISSQPTKESDAFSKSDHRSTAHASDRTTPDDHGEGTSLDKGSTLYTSLAEGVYSKTGGRRQLKERPLEDTNRNKASQDHRSRRTSPHRRDAFTHANDLAIGSKNDHLAGLPLHDDRIKIRATTETSPLNRDNRQDNTSTLRSDGLGLADYQHKEEVQNPFSQVEGAKQPDLDFISIDSSLRSDR